MVDLRTGRGSVLVASFWQETNTYSPRTTTLDDFVAFELLEGIAIAEAHRGVRSVIGGAIDELGDAAEFGMAVGAWPAGPTDHATATQLLDRFATVLGRHRGVAGVLLNLHGAMVAEGYPDVELEVVRRVERELGDVPVVAVLDFHANPSREFVAACDAIVAYRTYPHVDMYERGAEAGRILATLLAEERRSQVLLRKLPLLTSPLGQGTDLPHVQEVIMAPAELRPPLGAFVTPGFPYSDVARAGMSIAVNSWADIPAPTAVVDALAARAWASRDRWAPRVSPVTEAVREASRASGRVMLADVGDNIGGGSPGDGTALLAALLDVKRSSLVLLWDPATAAVAHSLGPGAVFDARLGGHTDDLHGATLTERVEVVSVFDGHYRAGGEWMGGMEFDLGPTAVLRCRAVTVVVTTVSTPPFHVEQITAHGLDPAAFDILTAKGALAWQDGYGPYVDQTIFVDTPGVTPAFPEVLTRNERFADEPGEPWTYPQREEI
jgi:microcystin degradation protein MlrC